MTYEEYMNTLENQIKNKKAKDLVRQEFENHIEEQQESYEAEGLDREAALAEAVRQMGDPIKTGQDLNRIHRPKFPLRLFALAIILTIFGICMQGIIFYHIDRYYLINPINTQSIWVFPPAAYLATTIFFNLIGLALIFGILHFNYNYFVKYIFVFYGIYLCIIVAGNFLITDYNIYWKYNYSLWMVYPLIFAGLLYRFRNRGVRGILICEGLTLMVYLTKIMFPGMAALSSASLECYIIIVLLLFLSIMKGIFDFPKKSLYAAGCLIFAPILSLCFLPVLPAYYGARIKNLLHLFSGVSPEGEEFYLINHLREQIPQFNLFGGNTLPEYINQNELYSNFMLTSAFSWFGIIPGLLVILLLIAFCILTLKSALHQHNRLGMLLGSACGISMLVRILAYIFSNFGYGVYYTVSIPFLAYGGINILLNAVYVGFVLCIFRYSNILREECS